MLGVAVMTPETQALVKVAAGTALVIALVITFLERWFRPSYNAVYLAGFGKVDKALDS
jgi:hypothetical protein